MVTVLATCKSCSCN